MVKLTSWLKLGLIFIFLVLADQVTKFVFPIVFLNKGITLGFLTNFNQWIGLFLLISTLLIFKFFLKNKSFADYLMMNFFWAGAVSNLIDRFIFGGVRDWWRWPILGFSNNLADVWITLGLLGIIYFEYGKTNKNSF